MNMADVGRLLELPCVVRRNWSLAVAHALIRSHRTDQYVVSFPRSGSTWLRTILAVLVDVEEGSRPGAFNRIIPGVSGRRLSLVWRLAHPRLMHSHTTFRKRLPRVVYLVRDGRDALVSAYHYGVTRRARERSFSEWFELYCRHWYGPRWDENVKGWLTRGRRHLGLDLMVVKFEDLKSETERRVREIASFLRIETDDERVRKAIDLASLENARERELREKGPLSSPDASFYRGGRTGQWRDYMVEPLYEHFLAISGDALSLAGYPR